MPGMQTKRCTGHNSGPISEPCREGAAAETATQLAGSKATLDALLQRASTAKETLAAACQAEGTELVAALREGEQVQHDLSACIADYRTVLAAETSDDVFFKVVNLPQWPCARFTAWLSRNKVSVKARSSHSEPHVLQHQRPSRCCRTKQATAITRRR